VSTKTYGQLCPLARSLDLLGDRWTLLVVRELFLGPKRFKDLLDALPAMGTNRLSQRLKTLDAAGVVQKRVLPPPASARVYELTPSGEQLRGPLLELAVWGTGLPADERIDPTTARAELVALAMTGAASFPASAGLSESYEFQIGEETFHIRVDDGRLTTRSGPAPSDPAIVVVCDLETFLALALREMTPARALREGAATLTSGSRSTFTRAFEILGYKPPMPTTAWYATALGCGGRGGDGADDRDGQSA
jgi:DNA-binding HxlR family transcriptional regulator